MFPEAARARILADLSLASTCIHQNGSSIIDFFVVSEDLAQIADDARIVVTACTAPHRPVSVTIPVGGGANSKAAKSPGLRPASAASGLGGVH